MEQEISDEGRLTCTTATNKDDDRILRNGFHGKLPEVDINTTLTRHGDRGRGSTPSFIFQVRCGDTVGSLSDKEE